MRVSTSRLKIASDGLAIAEWDAMVTLAAAANGGRARYLIFTKSLGSKVNIARLGVYLMLMLRRALLDRYGADLTVPNLSELSSRLYPRWHEILVEHDKTMLLETLSTSVGLADESRETVDPSAVASMIVVLGVMFEDPRQELSRLRPELAESWKRGEAEWRRAKIWP